MYKKIILKKGKDQAVKRFHPWIFSGAIDKNNEKPEEGEIVEVYSCENNFLGIGHYQIGSIAVRLFSFEKCTVDINFWVNRLKTAWQLRNEPGIINHNDTNAYRLVNGEGDGFPGLIIDCYNGVAVMQIHSVGMYKNRRMLCDALKEVLGKKLTAVYDKSASTLPFKAGLNPVDGFLDGQIEDNLIISEYGNRFEINLKEGQKTGFFLDQRENRKLLGNYSLGKKVCNIFGYTGGFSVYALKGRAELVHTIDSSDKAIELAKRNVELNFGKSHNHEAFALDAWDFLDKKSLDYDLIILDPPAFAKHLDVLDNALKGYKRLNEKAIRQIKKGGILFTFSCSQVVSRQQFKQAVFVAAANAKRNVRVIQELTQPPDHPVSIFHPEGEYLKGLVLYVE